MTCLICEKPLTGQQKRFCCETHAHRWYSRQRAARGDFKRVWQKRKAEDFEHKPCPLCGARMHRASARCIKCHQRYRQQHAYKSPRQEPALRCAYCAAELTERIWHGLIFLRCPGCGLETTTSEARRIASEEAA